MFSDHTLAFKLEANNKKWEIHIHIYINKIRIVLLNNLCQWRNHKKYFELHYKKVQHIKTCRIKLNQYLEMGRHKWACKKKKKAESLQGGTNRTTKEIPQNVKACKHKSRNYWNSIHIIDTIKKAKNCGFNKPNKLDQFVVWLIIEKRRHKSPMSGRKKVTSLQMLLQTVWR